MSNSLNVGSHPHISTSFLRIGVIDTNPNLLKKDPSRNFTRVDIFRSSEMFKISSIDIPNAKKSAIIDPADEPEIS